MLYNIYNQRYGLMLMKKMVIRHKFYDNYNQRYYLMLMKRTVIRQIIFMTIIINDTFLCYRKNNSNQINYDNINFET